MLVKTQKWIESLYNLRDKLCTDLWNKWEANFFITFELLKRE